MGNQWSPLIRYSQPGQREALPVTSTLSGQRKMGEDVMRITAVAILVLCLVHESFGADFKNYEAPGNLESKNDLECVESEKLSNRYTPADLYKAISKCVNQDKYKEGAFMFALAGVYGRFDSFRVADNTAHQAIAVLRMQTFSSLGKEKENAFKESLKNTLGNPDGLASICKEIRSLGTPDYYPRYMVQHGMGAFQKNNSGNGLVADFDSKAAWEKSLDTYLHCPKQ